MDLDKDIKKKIYNVDSNVLQRLDLINRRIEALETASLGNTKKASTQKNIEQLSEISFPNLMSTPGASFLNQGTSRMLSKIKKEVEDHEGGYIYFADLETNSKLSYLKDGDILQFSYIKTPVKNKQLDFKHGKVQEVYGKTRDNRPLSEFAKNVSHFDKKILDKKGLSQDQMAEFGAYLFDADNESAIPPMFVGHNWMNADIGKWIGVSMEQHNYMTVEQARAKSHDTYFDAKVLQKNVLGSSKGMRINGKIADLVAGYDLSGAHDAANDIGATAAIYAALYKAATHIDLKVLKELEEKRKSKIPMIIGGGDIGYTFEHHSPQISVLVKIPIDLNKKISNKLNVKYRPRVCTVSYVFNQKKMLFYDVNYKDGFKMPGKLIGKNIDRHEIMDAIIESQNVEAVEDIPYQDISRFYQDR